jgi:hypothetical protein
LPIIVFYRLFPIHLVFPRAGATVLGNVNRLSVHFVDSQKVFSKALGRRPQPVDSAGLADRNAGLVLLALVHVSFEIRIRRWRGAVPRKLRSIVVHTVKVDLGLAQQGKLGFRESREALPKLGTHGQGIILSKP